MHRSRSRQGFNLVEMMLAISIIGILSAIAIPTFGIAVARSKTGESSSNLSAMFKAAATYYVGERGDKGAIASVATYCTVDDGGPVPVVPDEQKQAAPADPSFRAIGMSMGDLVYYSYGLITASGTGSCGNGPNNSNLYTFYANGDLDGDGVYSTFELAAGTDSSNQIYHARAITIFNETE